MINKDTLMRNLEYIILTLLTFFMVSCGGSGTNSTKDIILSVVDKNKSLLTDKNVILVSDKNDHAPQKDVSTPLSQDKKDVPTPLLQDKDTIVFDETEIRIKSLGMNKKIHTNISLGDTPRDVYLLLSNYSIYKVGKVTIKHKHKKNQIQKRTKKAYQKRINPPYANIVHAPKHVEAFRKNMKKYFKNDITYDAKSISVSNKNEKDVIGDSTRFYKDLRQDKFTDATARKVTSNISTVFGNRILNIWVSNDSFDSGFGCKKHSCITQTMVDALSDSFLKAGKDNDIYDWVTNIYGEEWGSHSNDYAISKNNEITILLTDIDDDNSVAGGVVGFFYPKDNWKKSSIPYSNERIMLYADALLFSIPNGEWDIDDFWPKEIVSTLAHEFQHMIHFYQKEILRGIVSDSWVNEMLSESTEDLIATKIRYEGSRGVVYTDGSAGGDDNPKGRYPLFNQKNRLSLTTWEDSLANYSNVNAFGAYLIRNYGGAKLLHDILHNKHDNEDAIVAAVHKTANGSEKTFNDLLREWGIAVILSDNENLDEDLPRYNTGDFTEDTYNNSIYEIGSINFFNYIPEINMYQKSGIVNIQGNYYYKVGSDLSGDIELDLTLNGETEATLIIK